MSNLNKFRKSTVAILTALLLIAIAAPLASFATAAGAPTASLDKSSGPNGTVITVSGTGFGASEQVAATQSPINVSIDGHAANLNVITISASLTAGSNPAVTIGSLSQLQTTAAGVLSGKIILYGLTAGAHTVIISDASTSVVAGTFTITAPSVTVSPTTVAAGDSVTVSGSAFPTAPALSGVTYTNTIVAGTFAGTAISVAAGSSTASSSQLSSNTITKGAYTATVSLPAITAGAAFTLRDAWNNNATTTLALGTPTVTLSPASGPVGTEVTATITGFGPTATIASVKIGNNASASPAASFTSSTVTEQGSAVVVFTTPAGTNNSQAGVIGAQTVTITDSNGNVGTATFTVTPKVTLTLGNLAANSGTTYAPKSTTACLYVTATGFKASSVVTITAPAQIPIAWTNSTSTWVVSPNTYSTTTGRITTDANGAITFMTDAASTPTQAGSYSITISDGTNSVSTIITITTTGNIMGASASTGAKGSSVTVAYFGTMPAAITLDGTTVATPTAAAQAWPTITTNFVAFAVTANSGVHTITATGFNAISYTVLSTSLSVVNPLTASVGTVVTMVGSGFTSGTAAVTMQGESVPVVYSALTGNTLVATFQVPNYIPGTYTLSLSDGTNSASTTFAVSQAQIQISPTTSTLGTALAPVTIAITGSGFKANEAITVYFDQGAITATTAVGLTTINTNGGMLINSGFVIPTTATAGAHTITVVGANGASATATFNIQPKLTALSAVRPGAQIAITGNGFSANSVQTLTVNGTATTWLNVGVTPAQALATGTVVKTDSSGNLMTSTTVGFVVASTTAAGTLEIVVTDALGYSASTTLTVLDTPAITLGSSSIVAGTIATGVSIAGTGFTPGSRTLTANLYQGATFVAAVTLVGSPVTVGADGVFKATAGVTFSLPASVAAGDYTLRVTATSPTETADAAITVLGLPTLVAPTTAASGSNVTISVTGISKITDATFSSVALVTASTPVTGQFGSITMKADFTKTTWFIIPTSLFAGTYLLTISDSNTGLSIQQAITVTPAMTVAPTTGVKGATIAVTATGFASNSALTAKVNGAAVTLSAATSSVTGGIAAATFTVPITATATNTLTITDAAGNTASATFTLTTPTITLDKETANVGNTVQILGSAFTNGAIVIQVGGQIVTTTPATVTATAGSFMAYVTVPAGLSGNVTITATDSANNVGTAYITIGGSSTSTAMPDQTVMDTTKQMTNDAGTATSSFSAGSTANAGFVLQTAGSPRDVIVKVTWQGPDGKVYGMSSQTATMDTTARQITFGQTIPAGAMPGTWTAQLQVYALDGVTALAVATLTFTVA